MNNMNILKEHLSFQQDIYKKASNVCGFKEVWSLFADKDANFRYFNLVHENGGLRIIPQENLLLQKQFKIFFDYGNKEQQYQLLTWGKEKTYNIKSKKRILNHLHLDIILAIELLKSSKDNEIKNKFISYLLFELKDEKLVNRLTRANYTTPERSNIYTFNKNSVIISFNEELDKNKQQLNDENLKLIKENNIINTIEIQNGFDNKKLSLFLQKMNKVCSKVIGDNPSLKQHKFDVKIRKIKRTYKSGMYLKSLNTIIVDPRHVDSFTHELGHWFHTFAMPEMVDVNECEKFAEDFSSRFVDL